MPDHHDINSSVHGEYVRSKRESGWEDDIDVTGTGRYSDNRCSDKIRIVASERNPVCGGKVSSKPKGLTRCEVLGSGGKPLPMAPTRGSGSAVAPVGSKGRSCRGQSPGRHEFYCILGSSVSSPAWSAMQNCVQCLMWKKKCLDAPTIAQGGNLPLPLSRVWCQINVVWPNFFMQKSMVGSYFWRLSMLILSFICAKTHQTSAFSIRMVIRQQPWHRQRLNFRFRCRPNCLFISV